MGRCPSTGTQKASRISVLGTVGLSFGDGASAPLSCPLLPALEENGSGPGNSRAVADFDIDRRVKM